MGKPKRSLEDVHYIVRKGDTLSKIAKAYTGNAMRYNEFLRYNNISNLDRIDIGQDIVIPREFVNTIKDTNLPELVVVGNKKK